MEGDQTLKHRFLIQHHHTNLEFLLEQEYRESRGCMFLELKYFYRHRLNQNLRLFLVQCLKHFWMQDIFELNDEVPGFEIYLYFED